MPSINMIMLQKVAHGLGELKNDMAFKGDVMPTSEEVLGFNNRWYQEGIRNKIEKVLQNGTKIFVFPPEYYLAAKFEAHKDRGGKDLRQSHDFEDIIYIFDSCPDILNSISEAEKEVKTFVRTECQSLLDNDSLNEGIECALPYSSSPDRKDLIINIIEKISEPT